MRVPGAIEDAFFLTRFPVRHAPVDVSEIGRRPVAIRLRVVGPQRLAGGPIRAATWLSEVLVYRIPLTAIGVDSLFPV